MRARQCIRMYFTACLLIGIMSQPSWGFMITPQQPGANTLYRATQEYSGPGFIGITTLNPLSVTELPRGGTPGFLAALNRQFGPNGTVDPGWTFEAFSGDLEGTLTIDVYAALGDGTRVGAGFGVDFEPIGEDPTNFHWIQRVISNHRIQTFRDGAGTMTVTDFGHGTPQDQIDIILGDGGQRNPYYDTFGLAGPLSFNDLPTRLDITEEHFWTAELYLVVENGPRSVLIFNGVTWGWRNTVAFPEPPAVLLSAIGLFMFVGLIGLKHLRERKGKKRVPCPNAIKLRR